MVGFLVMANVFFQPAILGSPFISPDLKNTMIHMITIGTCPYCPRTLDFAFSALILVLNHTSICVMVQQLLPCGGHALGADSVSGVIPAGSPAHSEMPGTL